MLPRLMLTALLLSSLNACKNDSASPAPSPSATMVSIVPGSSTLTTNAYAPNPVTVSVGAAVTWVNNDAVAHTSTANGGLWASGTIQPGGRFSVTFNSAGSFPYLCTIHPNMVGTVNVQ